MLTDPFSPLNNFLFENQDYSFQANCYCLYSRDASRDAHDVTSDDITANLLVRKSNSNFHIL